MMVCRPSCKVAFGIPVLTKLYSSRS
jgi:hypothetical protein